MKHKAVLITGVNGEMGHSLISHLSKNQNIDIVALDINEPETKLISYCHDFIKGDILDENLLDEIFENFHFTTIYHLASILSTKAEINPYLAQKVNVQGTASLLEHAAKQSENEKIATKFIYPSSIAVYGLESVDKKNNLGKICENEWCEPTTMYGCNKLSCEQLGTYYSNYYRFLDETGDEKNKTFLDFRSIRFPGLISAFTIPTGGTSDYGPEMLHHSAQNKPYNCFVRPDTKLPFMVMPDAIKALVSLEKADKHQLSQHIYNITSFNPSAEELVTITKQAFPNAQIQFRTHAKRQAIVDSWPADVDDSAARKDWNWQPDFDLKKAFFQYLIPTIKKRY
ncbi:MAG: NAD-dependent epimerase/dehydratase family protein [Anaerolineaceae bacterium]|nr:NAD-dependent epimerase/dehydratase family protein [Anaerolineaceae bacterium]